MYTFRTMQYVMVTNYFLKMSKIKVLVFVIVKKIREPRSEKNSSRIRILDDPGSRGKKAQHPGSGSATLCSSNRHTHTSTLTNDR
jgi:hypothetical protein